MRDPVDFVHLHVHSEYSLLDGLCRIPDLLDTVAAQAEEAGQSAPAVAVTDHGNMYGAYTFAREAERRGIHPVLGAELYVAPSGRERRVPQESPWHLVLLVENEAGYRNLVQLVTRSYAEGFYYHPRVDHELLAQHGQGLIALSACIQGEVAQKLAAGDEAGAAAAVRFYQEAFGADHFFLELQRNGVPGQEQLNQALMALARRTGAGLVATNDAHYLRREEAAVHDVLLCVQTGRSVHDQDRLRFPSDQFYLRSPREMAELFADVPETLRNTRQIADRCSFRFPKGTYHLPAYPQAGGRAPEEFLRSLAAEGAARRYGRPLPAAVQERLQHELEVIIQMGFASYFLVVWDFVRFARQQGIAVGPGRGSAAGSVVAYALGITQLDPLRYGLLFERFLNPERVTMPDIDIDFCYERRGEVIDYVSRIYGQDRVAQIATFGTLQARAAVRDVGRALGMRLATVDKVARLIPRQLGITLAQAVATTPELQALARSDPEVARLLALAQAVEGLPRHVSTHAAGVVIADRPLTEYLPLQQTSEGTRITQYPMGDVADLGLLKMDFLGLKTLTLVQRTLALIRQEDPEAVPDLDHLRLDDPAVYKMLASGQTLGVFQLESSMFHDLLQRLQPERFADLVAALALGRPGPMGRLSDYIERRHGRQPVAYPHPEAEPILAETYGIMVYQEQVMEMAHVLAGFSLGQADLLRRAMGKKDARLIAGERDRFVAGAVAHSGMTREQAEHLFDEMAQFAQYGFNKSHAAAYALLSYQTAYLKHYWPAQFMAALLSLAGDDDKIRLYLAECRRLGLAVLPPSVNESGVGFSVRGRAILFGLESIKNVGTGQAEAIVEERQARGPYASLYDFCQRLPARLVNIRSVEALIKAGAFDWTGMGRPQLLAEAANAVRRAQNAVLRRPAGLRAGTGSRGAASASASISAASVASAGAAGQRGGALGPGAQEIPDQGTLFSFDAADLPAGWEQASRRHGSARRHGLPPPRMELPPSPGPAAAPAGKPMASAGTGAAPAGTAAAPAGTLTTPCPRSPQELAWELEALGVYLSGHPLESRSRWLQAWGARPLGALDELPEGEPVLLAGMVQGLKLLNTRRGQRMARCTLEDATGRLPLVIFPQAWAEGQKWVADGAVIGVQARLEWDDEGAATALASRIYPLPQEAFLLWAQPPSPAGLEQLARILAAHPGPAPVYLRLPRSAGNRQPGEQIRSSSAGGAVLVLLPPDRWVEPGPALYQDLAALPWVKVAQAAGTGGTGGS
ncbi:MAG: DNA polymerase III subunit alpha [Firmicutes bacterium]|nr:DNA polymerase III subunit alpha [Bacillota bacterium]